MNPVRAEMVEHPADYRWSSYQANGQGEKSALITLHSLYQDLGRTDPERQQAYRELFRYELEPGVIDKIRKATNGNFSLGNNRFTNEISKMLGRRIMSRESRRAAKKASS